MAKNTSPKPRHSPRLTRSRAAKAAEARRKRTPLDSVAAVNPWDDLASAKEKKDHQPKQTRAKKENVTPTAAKATKTVKTSDAMKPKRRVPTRSSAKKTPEPGGPPLASVEPPAPEEPERPTPKEQSSTTIKPKVSNVKRKASNVKPPVQITGESSTSAEPPPSDQVIKETWIDDADDYENEDELMQCRSAAASRFSIISVSELLPTPGVQPSTPPLGGFTAMSSPEGSFDRNTASFGTSPNQDDLIEAELSLPTCRELSSNDSFIYGNHLVALSGETPESLPLPPVLNRLMNVFLSLERLIQQRRMKGLPMFLHIAPPGMPSLQQALSRATRIQISDELIRQIVWLAPTLLKLIWSIGENAEKAKVRDLELIQLPNDPLERPIVHVLTSAALQERGSIFRTACIRWVYLKEVEFLRGKGHDIAPLHMHIAWHPEFHTESEVPAIPLCPLPGRTKVDQTPGLSTPKSKVRSRRELYSVPAIVAGSPGPPDLTFHTPQSGNRSIWAREGLGGEDGPQRTPFTAMSKMMSRMNMASSSSPSSGTSERRTHTPAQQGTSERRTLTPGQQRLLQTAENRRKKREAESALQGNLNMLRDEIEAAEDAASVMTAAANVFLGSSRLPFMALKTITVQLERNLQSVVPGITEDRIEKALRSVAARSDGAVQILSDRTSKELIKVTKDAKLIADVKKQLLSDVEEIVSRNEALRQESIANWITTHQLS